MLTSKQEIWLNEQDARINLLYGSVRSGKTFISLLKYALKVGEYPIESQHLLVGRTLTTLKRNCLLLLKDLIGDSFKYSLSQKTGSLFGRTVFFEGANDERAEAKIRGLTLATAYIDELTLIPEDFYKMLLSRLSITNAKLYATTNPDSPMNYVKTNIIDNDKIDKKCVKFTIDENTFLDPEYVLQIKNEYTGVFYDRYILGDFVVADGLVYPNFDKNSHISKTENRNYVKYYISNDYGTQNSCVFLLWGLGIDSVWYCVKEYYHKGRDGKQKTVDEYYADLLDFAKDCKILQFIRDKAPIAASFNLHLRRKGDFVSRDCDNEVLAGIQDVATALNRRLIKINDCCINTIREFEMYSWNKNKPTDEPIKENDDAIDAVRYFVRTLKITQPKYESLLG